MNVLFLNSALKVIRRSLFLPALRVRHHQKVDLLLPHEPRRARADDAAAGRWLLVADHVVFVQVGIHVAKIAISLQTRQ